MHIHRWGMLLISLWIRVGFVPGMRCKNGTVNNLSREDVLLLKDEQDPKCFTRTGGDFTCFFETADNRTFDLLYKRDGLVTRCEMCVQRLEEGTFLHVCLFPSEVYLFVAMQLEVVEHKTNISLHSREVSVEDHYLLDPPLNVSLHQNEEVGQLLVSWQTKLMPYCEDAMMYRIHYFSKGLGEKTKEVKRGEHTRHLLDSLVPGEEVEAQVAAKCVFDLGPGHWSAWSHPVRAVVPQSADDVSLMCYTSDLQNITCQWDGRRYGVEKEYKLFYKIGLSEEWTVCLADGNFTDLCHFHGFESRKVKVKLSRTPDPFNRSFYAQEFTLTKTIKTSPPAHLKGALTGDRLCLEWEAPLLSLSAHLQYEVGYQTRGSEAWMTVSLEGPETGTCLKVSTGSHYSVRVRAKPNGSIYSGHWSDWSDVLTGYIPVDKGMWFMLCIPVLIAAIILISTCVSKLKQYFWPPVPSLDKVLQGFLTDSNKQTWQPPLTSKQCSEETPASVVEIVSEDEIPGLEKLLAESTQLLSTEGSVSSAEQVDGNPGTEIFQDYVTLNKDSVILCPNVNKYMYEKVGEEKVPVVDDELSKTCQCSCTDFSVCVPPCDLLNHSYLPLAEAADRLQVTPARGPGNVYTNLPCS